MTGSSVAPSQWFKRYNAKAPGEGGGEEIAGGQGRGLAGEDPRGVGADGEPGAGAGGPCRADRRPQPGRSAGRSAPGRRPEAGGGVEPGSRTSISARSGTGRSGAGRPETVQQAGRVERRNAADPGRAGRRQQAGGAAGGGKIARIEARLKEIYDRVRTAIDERIRQAGRAIRAGTEAPGRAGRALGRSGCDNWPGNTPGRGNSTPSG